MSLLDIGYFNAKLKDKAYLIEFYQGSDLRESFSFCLPAQNEQFTMPQKVYETKTYDGSVVDDYGNDMETINLSGSTYNTETRIIYSGKGVRKAVTGEEEIFKLRDLLREYGKSDKLKNKHIYLYDLSSPKLKSWEIYPKELKIERSKDNPFSYNYSFNLLADNGINYHKTKVGWLDSFVEAFNTFKEKAESYIEVLSVGMTYFDDAIDAIHVIEDTIDKTEGIIQSYVNVVNGYFEAVATVSNELVGLGDYAIKSPLRIYSMGISVFNATRDMLEAVNNLKTWCRNCGDEFSKTSDIVEKQYNASSDEVIDEWNKLTNQMCNEAEAVHANSIMATSNNSFVCEPGGEDDDTIRLTYGFKERTLKESDTWDNIANEVYGDPSLGNVLAVYNGTLSESSSSDIVAGKTIYLPIFDENKSTSENEVYNEPGVIDNYGKDIQIADGDYSAQNGDIGIVSGVNNLTQALLSRLSTSINTRIRNTVYGIKSYVGNSIALANNYLANSIMQTILADPRIVCKNSLHNGICQIIICKSYYADYSCRSKN